MMCLSFHFQFNEANASTKSDKLDVQQTSQQPVVKQQNKSVNVSKDKVVATQTKVQTPSKVTNRNQASLQKTMAPSKRAHVTSTHVTPKSTKVKPSSQNFSKQKQPTKVNKKLSQQIKPQKASKVTRTQSARPQLLAQTTKTRSKPTSSKVSASKPSTKVAVVTKSKTAKPSAQTTVKASKKHHQRRRRIITIKHLSVGHLMCLVVIMYVISVKRRKNQVLMTP